MSVIKIVARYLMDQGPGGVFTIAELERYVSEQTGKKRVEVDRRVRDLRAYRWTIDSYREDRSLKPDQHRVVRIGDDVTHPACRPAAQGCPASLRRGLFMRDGKRCKICGIGAGEEYPDQPGRRARLTIGRILPGSRGGVYSWDNCQVECDRCNEHNRDTYWGQEAA
jgi:hypothetical protein